MCVYTHTQSFGGVDIYCGISMWNCSLRSQSFIVDAVRMLV